MNKFLPILLLFGIVGCSTTKYLDSNGKEYSWLWDLGFPCNDWANEWAITNDGYIDPSAKNYFNKICMSADREYLLLHSTKDEEANIRYLKDSYIIPEASENYYEWIGVISLEEYLADKEISDNNDNDFLANLIKGVIEDYPEAKARAERENRIRQQALIEGQKRARAQCSGNVNC